MSLVSRKLTMLLVVYLISSLSGCATNKEHTKNSSNIANIKVVDSPNYKKELFRYILWQGTKYGPKAFIYDAKKRGIEQIYFTSGNPESLACALSLAKEINAKLSVSEEVISGNQLVDVSKAKKIDEVCKIQVDFPKPVLPDGFAYVNYRKKHFTLNDDKNLTAQSFLKKLKESNISAIVMREPIIRELMCFISIAGLTNLKLFDVQKDSSLKEWVAKPTKYLDQSCER